ncbi:MAG: hypothetical protein WBM44_22300 [Waterburya sp.]
MGRAAKRRKSRAAKRRNTIIDRSFGEIFLLKLLPTDSLPNYVPPTPLQHLYEDWRSDRSTKWLEVAPTDWKTHMNTHVVFEHYKDYCSFFPCDERFDEWLKNDGIDRSMAWRVTQWKFGLTK